MLEKQARALAASKSSAAFKSAASKPLERHALGVAESPSAAVLGAVAAFRANAAKPQPNARAGQSAGAARGPPDAKQMAVAHTRKRLMDARRIAAELNAR